MTNFYDSDLSKNDLKTQLLTFKLQFKEEKVDLKDIIEVMKKPGYSDLLSEISTVLKLILVLPAANAQSERVFSSLRRIKTYLRGTMSQARLNHVMFMNIHKEETKKVSLDEVADEFIAKSERRRADFGVK